MKYRLTENVIEYEGKRLFQIQAVKNFQADQWYIQAGELGGYVESERNLSQQGSCWLMKRSKVMGNASVSGNAYVSGSSVISGNAQVFDNALVVGSSKVTDNAKVYGNAFIMNCEMISGDAQVFEFAVIAKAVSVVGSAKIYGNAEIESFAKVGGECEIFDHALIKNQVNVSGKARIFGKATIQDDVHIWDNAVICDATIREKAKISGNARVIGRVIDVCGNVALSDDAFIQSQSDFIYIENFGLFETGLTIFSTEDGFKFRYAGKAFNAEKFITNSHKAIEEYQFFIDVIKQCRQKEKIMSVTNIGMHTLLHYPKSCVTHFYKTDQNIEIKFELKSHKMEYEAEYFINEMKLNIETLENLLSLIKNRKM